MKWLRLFAHLRRLTLQLQRVADGLDRAFPPPDTNPPHPQGKRSTVMDLSSYDPEADYEAEQEEERLRALGEDQLRDLHEMIPAEEEGADV